MCVRILENIQILNLKYLDFFPLNNTCTGMYETKILQQFCFYFLYKKYFLADKISFVYIILSAISNFYIKTKRANI